MSQEYLGDDSRDDFAQAGGMRDLATGPERPDDGTEHAPTIEELRKTLQSKVERYNALRNGWMGILAGHEGSELVPGLDPSLPEQHIRSILASAEANMQTLSDFINGRGEFEGNMKNSDSHNDLEFQVGLVQAAIDALNRPKTDEKSGTSAA